MTNLPDEEDFAAATHTNVIELPKRVQCFWGLDEGQRCPTRAVTGHSHCKVHLAMLPDTTRWPDGLDPDELRRNVQNSEPNL